MAITDELHAYTTFIFVVFNRKIKLESKKSDLNNTEKDN